jgi:hypothetical protein
VTIVVYGTRRGSFGSRRQAAIIAPTGPPLTELRTVWWVRPAISAEVWPNTGRPGAIAQRLGASIVFSSNCDLAVARTVLSLQQLTGNRVLASPRFTNAPSKYYIIARRRCCLCIVEISWRSPLRLPPSPQRPEPLCTMCRCAEWARSRSHLHRPAHSRMAFRPQRRALDHRSRSRQQSIPR